MEHHGSAFTQKAGVKPKTLSWTKENKFSKVGRFRHSHLQIVNGLYLLHSSMRGNFHCRFWLVHEQTKAAIKSNNTQVHVARANIITSQSIGASWMTAQVIVKKPIDKQYGKLIKRPFRL